MTRLVHCWSSDHGIEGSAATDRLPLERGWEVCHTSPPGPRVALAEARGAQWFPHHLERRLNVAGDFAASFKLYRELRARDVDILHTHHIKVGLVGRVVGGLARVPIVVHTHHGLGYSLDTPPLARWLHATSERLANLAADAVLYQSEDDARALLATHAVPPAKLTWIGNGINLERFRPELLADDQRNALRRTLGVGPEEVLFLAVGRLVAEKGIVELVEAYRSARREEPRVRLALAGFRDADKSDAVSPAFLDQAERDGVAVLGQRADMPELLAMADVVVLASHREGIPRALLEGLAMGRPLLGTAIRGIRQVIRSGENGLLVPVKNASALAGALLQLTRDQPLRHRLAATNAQEAREHYDVRQVAARVMTVYERLLTERRR